MKVLTRWWFVALLLLGITSLHMVTGTGSVLSHNVFRRLYYLPIILAAFGAGRLGGGLAALGSAALYAPHAFLLHHHLDPAPAGDKLLEMLLFVVVGVLTGLLVERERRASEARLAAEGRAERLESLVTLTSGLAHEVRNPLASIQGTFEILGDDYGKDSPKRRILEVGLRETSRLDRVLRDFIDFARPRPPERRSTDLAQIARRVAESASVAREGVSVTLAGAGAEVLVEVDPDQLEQCLVNLALNAVQWSPEGETVRIEVRAGRAVTVIVEDRGPGVDAADREQIFDPYFTRRAGGSGLGLAICARLAAANSAALSYEPRDGGGARFSLVIGGGER